MFGRELDSDGDIVIHFVLVFGVFGQNAGFADIGVADHDDFKQKLSAEVFKTLVFDHDLNQQIYNCIYFSIIYNNDDDGERRRRRREEETSDETLALLSERRRLDLRSEEQSVSGHRGVVLLRREEEDKGKQRESLLLHLPL